MDPEKDQRPSPQPKGTASEKSNGFHASNQVQAYARDGLQQAIDNAVGDWWAQGAIQAIRQLAMAGRGFDVDHVLDLVGSAPDSHYVGAVFSAAQRAKIIEPVGCRVARDGRLLRVWYPGAAAMDEAS